MNLEISTRDNLVLTSSLKYKLLDLQHTVDYWDEIGPKGIENKGQKHEYEQLDCLKKDLVDIKELITRLEY